MNKIITGIILTSCGIGINTTHSIACKPILCVENLHTICNTLEGNMITGLGSLILITGVFFVCFGIYQLIEKRRLQND